MYPPESALLGLLQVIVRLRLLRSELALRTPFRDVRIGEEGCDLDLGRTLQRRLRPWGVSEALKEMKHGSVRSAVAMPSSARMSHYGLIPSPAATR